MNRIPIVLSDDDEEPVSPAMQESIEAMGGELSLALLPVEGEGDVWRTGHVVLAPADRLDEILDVLQGRRP